MSYNEQNEPKVFVNGSTKVSRAGNPRVESYIINLDEIKRELGTEYVRIMVFDGKEDPEKKKFMFVKGDPKYWKSALSNSQSAASSRAQEADTAYGNTGSSGNNGFIP